MSFVFDFVGKLSENENKIEIPCQFRLPCVLYLLNGVNRYSNFANLCMTHRGAQMVLYVYILYTLTPGCNKYISYLVSLATNLEKKKSYKSTHKVTNTVLLLFTL